MKAPAPAMLQVQQISVSEISPSPTNPRKSTDKIQLAELAQSIKSAGIQVPLSLRPFNGPNGNEAVAYEIVGGERRWRAAQMAGLGTVPAIVRSMTDEECRDAQLIENLQREDLSALEEADAYAGLIERLGSVAALAARVGKPLEYVTRRLKLRSLIEYSRQALADRLITIDHALLLAKLAAAEQEDVLRWTLDRNVTKRGKTEDLLETARKAVAEEEPYGYWEPQSVLELKRRIETTIDLALSRAPWDLADAKLVESAGACIACPSNTAANAALFGDLAIEEATCTDSKCFAAKKNAFVQIQMSAITEAGKDSVRLSWKTSDAKPRMKAEHLVMGQVFKAGQWVAAKKGECEHVIQGIAIDDTSNPWGNPDKSKKMGAKLLVCVTGGCKAHKKGWEKSPAQRNHGYDPKEEEEKRKKKAEAVAAENKIRLDLAKRAVAKVTKIPDEVLRSVVWSVARHGSDDLLAAIAGPGAGKSLEGAPIGSAGFAKAVAAIFLCESSVEIHQWSEPKTARDGFLKALKVLGVDGSSAWQKPKGSSPASPGAAKPKASPRKAAKKGGRK